MNWWKSLFWTCGRLGEDKGRRQRTALEEDPKLLIKADMHGPSVSNYFLWHRR